jgi:hypothetical protein
MLGWIVSSKLRSRFLAPAIACALLVLRTGQVRDLSALLPVGTKL